MKVSLLIPTRNEQGCISKVLKEVPAKIVNEIIIIDGHSTDNTIQEAQESLRKKDKVILQKGLGYGDAFLQGFKESTGDIIIMMDGDGSHDPKTIQNLVKKIEQGYEFVMASRYIKGGRSEDDTFLRFAGNMIFTWLTNFVHGTQVTDSLYLYTAVTREGFKKLHLSSKGFEFCTEIVVKAHRAGLKSTEIAAIERPRIAGKSKVNAFWHGLKILRMILRKFN